MKRTREDEIRELLYSGPPKFEFVPMESDFLDLRVKISTEKLAQTSIGRNNFTGVDRISFVSREAINAYSEGDLAHIMVKAKNPVRLISGTSSTVYSTGEVFQMKEFDVLELAFDEANEDGVCPLSLQKCSTTEDIKGGNELIEQQMEREREKKRLEEEREEQERKEKKEREEREAKEKAEKEERERRALEELKQIEEPATEIYTFESSTNSNLLQPQGSKSRFDELMDQYTSSSLPDEEKKPEEEEKIFSFFPSSAESKPKNQTNNNTLSDNSSHNLNNTNKSTTSEIVQPNKKQKINDKKEEESTTGEEDTPSNYSGDKGNEEPISNDGEEKVSKRLTSPLPKVKLINDLQGNSTTSTQIPVTFFVGEKDKLIYKGDVIKQPENYKKFAANPKTLLGKKIILYWPEYTSSYVGEIKKYKQH